jgi:hypothetical protein
MWHGKTKYILGFGGETQRIGSTVFYLITVNVEV